MSNTKPILSVRNLAVRYDGIVALEHVDLDIFADDFLGIIGPNGGGKSTLVKAIMGIVPHSGNITYSDTLCRGGKPHIGYLPQISAFDKSFPISVQEVILSGLQGERGFCGRFTKADRARIDELLEMVALPDIAKRPIGELSGGQLQRVMLCRAIISQPKLLILDEPTNFVDNRFENELYRILNTLAKSMAIAVVSHDIGTISSLVKSIICVNRHVHRHDSNIITEEQLRNYDCPIQIITHGNIPHTVLGNHHCPHCNE